LEKSVSSFQYELNFLKKLLLGDGRIEFGNHEALENACKNREVAGAVRLVHARVRWGPITDAFLVSFLARSPFRRRNRMTVGFLW